MRFLSFAIALSVGFVTLSPAHAFRMIQNTTVGRVTAGNLVTCNDPGGFVHWDQHAIPWQWNTTNQGAGKQDALQASLATWNAVAGSDYTLGGLDITSTAGFVTDGLNTMVWANGNGCVSPCLALTALVLQAGQRIVETDITFNNAFNWTTNGADFDTEAVATHELGHSLGMHHTELTGLPRPTMFASYFGADGRTLEADDTAALVCSMNRYPDLSGNTSVEYRAHVAALGWLDWMNDGLTAGTTGQSRQMEAAQIQLPGAPAGMGICYSAHIATLGWGGTACNGQVAGTTGQGRPIEAIRINLTGAPAGCSVEYRAHVAVLGWLPWVANNAVAGTTGQSRQMQALQVRLTNCP